MKFISNICARVGLRGLTLLLAFGFMGCGSLKPVEAPSPADEEAVSTILRAETQRWWGTPHRAQSGKGWDCSAFVQDTYAQVFAVTLPRTTAAQVKMGTKVRRKELRAGDLVFFRPSAKTRHVGFYLGDGEFSHVSSSRGVMISRLDESYWNTRYWTARRVLNKPITSAAPRRASQRTGW